MAREVGRYKRTTMTCQILWTRTDYLREIDNFAGNKRRVGKLSRPHRNIDILGHKIDRAARYQEINRHPWIAIQKFRQRWAKMIADHDRRRMYSQVAAR